MSANLLRGTFCIKIYVSASLQSAVKNPFVRLSVPQPVSTHVKA
jgi:hypothetical protein